MRNLRRNPGSWFNAHFAGVAERGTTLAGDARSTDGFTGMWRRPTRSGADSPHGRPRARHASPFYSSCLYDRPHFCAGFAAAVPAAQPTGTTYHTTWTPAARPSCVGSGQRRQKLFRLPRARHASGGRRVSRRQRPAPCSPPISPPWHQSSATLFDLPRRLPRSIDRVGLRCTARRRRADGEAMRRCLPRRITPSDERLHERAMGGGAADSP